MTTTRNVIEELLTSVAQVAPSVQTFYQWILQNLNIRDGPLENYGGVVREFLNRRNFYSLSNSLYEFVLGRRMNIF